MNIANTIKEKKTSPLAEARALALPSRQEMLTRAPSVQYFWDNNKKRLSQAWLEWEEETKADNIQNNNKLTAKTQLSDSILDEKLRAAVNNAWQQPSTETAVSDLWQEAAPGVYKAQFFDPTRFVELRDYLQQAAASNIPLRPPYGIVLNRNGAKLDPRSEGYLAAPSFQDFYQQLLDKYMRPIARLLFPEVVGFDTQTFGFSIQWQAGMDTSLRLHTDASAVTMNVNMNLPDEKFTGSEIDFYDPATGKFTRLSFEPGTAMIHRGNVAHAAQPITSGERSNIVLWLYGMQIPQNDTKVAIAAEQRWTVPTTAKDNVAPF
ncbi:2OG-Fe(II) oxygenase [Algibacillus agarilyticus]|uniref:2OG-Fe(II) oxygenase n=1 Tax=Algibacillus agarilyticus TaxID=2234133 RepID=UPI000DCF9C4C|nr:2OG-Fe(II) oxygenase [Algibacillus agarilyticus]